MSPILGITASQNYPRITGSYESIATATVSGSSNTITFTSIPSTYAHLQLRFSTQTNRATYTIDDGFLTFNSDTTSGNYYTHLLSGNGNNASSLSYAGGSGGGQGMFWPYAFGSTGGGTVPGIWGGGVLDVLDYASTTKNKTVRFLSGSDSNGVFAGGGYPAVNLNSGLWMNSASAVSTLTLKANGNFASGSSFALYGIKG